MRRRFRWVRLYQATDDAGLVCRRCGISYPTLRKWVRRFDESGEGGLASRSRRPSRSPNRRIFARERALFLDLRLNRKLGARRIQNELYRHHNLHLSLDTIHKVLITSPVPQLVRPVRRKTSHRYSRRIPGDRVQLDTCKIAPGCYQYTAVDDCTRTGSWRYSAGAPRPVRWPSWNASSKKCRFPCSGFKQIVAANSSRWPCSSGLWTTA